MLQVKTDTFGEKILNMEIAQVHVIPTKHTLLRILGLPNQWLPVVNLRSTTWIVSPQETQIGPTGKRYF